MAKEKNLDCFMNDPIEYFDASITKMHTIPRRELESLQREAMRTRFAQHRSSIEMVKNLADRLGVDEVNEFDDLVPLLFAHTAFNESERPECGNRCQDAERNRYRDFLGAVNGGGQPGVARAHMRVHVFPGHNGIVDHDT